MNNILILHHVSTLGGGTKSLIDLAVMLSKNNNVKICVPSNSIKIIQLAEKYGVNCYEVNTPIPSFNFYSGMPGILNRYTISRLFRFIKNRQLVEELMKLNPEVIFYNTSVTSLIAKDMPNYIKNVCIIRETFVDSVLNRIYINNFEKKFAGVAYIAEHEMLYLGLKKPKQVVIPDCLEPRDIQIHNQAVLKEKHNVSDKFCSLFMGGMTQIKGLDIALKATEKLDHKFCLLIAGNINRELLSLKHIIRHFYNVKYVSFLVSVRRRLDKLIALNKVVLLGYMDDISSAISLCDTLLFPSTAAHQPRPCIEAGEFKKPVILSDYEATKEYFIDGYNALTFMPKNAIDLSEKIIFLREHEDVRRSLAENNYKMTKEKHNYNKTQEVLNHFFNGLLN